MSIDPASQFVPTDTSVTYLLHQYGLPMQQWELARSGIANCTILLPECVLRVIRQSRKPLEEIRREVDFMEQLQTAGLPVPKVIIGKDGNQIQTVSIDQQEWHVLLMDRMPGIHDPLYTDTLLQSMAQYHAQLHLLGDAGKLLRTRQIILADPEWHALTPHEDELNDPAAIAFLLRAQAYRPWIPTLPGAWCHMDFDKENLLAGNDHTVSGILDFDDLQLSPPALCLGYTLWHLIACQADIDLYIHTYEQDRQLNDIERSFLSQAMLFRCYMVAAVDRLIGKWNEESLPEYLRQEAAINDWEYTARSAK